MCIINLNLSGKADILIFIPILKTEGLMNTKFNTFSYTETDLEKLPKRPERSNKGTFGRLLVIGGSYGMCGAAYLCGKAAYRSGVGLTEIYTCESNRTILQTLLPEAVLSLYNDNCNLRADMSLMRNSAKSSVDFNAGTLYSALERADAVVIGVGLGQSEIAKTVLSVVLQTANAPVVIDADALNILSKNNDLKEFIIKRSEQTSNRHGGFIITPHPAEMSRLTGKPVSEICDNLGEVASEVSEKYGCVCVLKDHNTVVASPGSDKLYVNMSGNSGMATGGSGDVLAGIIGALLAQGLSLEYAAELGVYIHGLAGDNAAAKLGECSVMASDIIDMLPKVFKAAAKH